MSDFHFLRPEWFLALPVALGLLWLLWNRQLRSCSWQEICDPVLLPHLLLGRSQRRANWPLWLMLTGLLLSLTALAGPTWKKQPQPLLRQQSALVILLDLSRSMNAGDLKPSRLERARLKIKDILHQRREGQTALVAFAGDAFVVTPLTDDTHTIELLLNSLDPELMPVQGSHPTRAMDLGAELLQHAGLEKGILLLVTDEDRPQAAETAAHELTQQGIELEILGVGTPEGAPIPLANGGFFKDARGNMVLPQLDETALRQLAAAGGGRYRRLSTDDSDFHYLLAAIDNHRLDQSKQETSRLGDRWQEAGIWLLLPLALLAASAFRRGWLAIFALLLLLPPSAEALEWQDLWQRPDQQAHNAFESGDYEAAANRFENQRWKSSALYRSGDYDAALKVQPEAHSADDWYNRGNIMARSGKLPEALKAYDQALKLNPDDEDTKTNRKLVEDALKRQQKQNQQKQASQQDKNQQQSQDQSSGQQRISSKTVSSKTSRMVPNLIQTGSNSRNNPQLRSNRRNRKSPLLPSQESRRAKRSRSLLNKRPKNSQRKPRPAIKKISRHKRTRPMQPLQRPKKSRKLPNNGSCNSGYAGYPMIRVG
jgi:Ca-activated chloride channel family protein